MILSLVVALDLEGGIGKEGKIPWHLNADMQLFRRITMRHHLLMGRKTFESIGRPLPGRKNMVLTKTPTWSAQGILVFNNLQGAIKFAEEHGETELFVIGGGDIFVQTLQMARRIYQTRVQTNANCTVFFPEIDSSNWSAVEVGSHRADEKNEYPFTFSILERLFEIRS